MKKLQAIVLALVLGITPLFGITIDKAAAAGATSHTWTGEAGNGSMADKDNWSTGEVPDEGDTLEFPAAPSGDPGTSIIESTINANLPGSPVMYAVNIGSSYASSTHYYQYAFNGNLRTTHLRTFESAPGSSVTFNVTAQMHGGSPSNNSSIYAEANTSISFIGFLNFNTINELTIGGPGQINIDTADMGVQGEIDVIRFKDSPATDNGGGIYHTGVGSAQPAQYIIDNSYVFVSEDSMKPVDQILVKGNGVLSLMSEQTYTADNIILENGAKLEAIKWGVDSQDPADPHHTTTVASDIELQGTVTYASAHTDLKLTGNISGNGTITPEAGTAGKIIVEPAAGKTNTSKLPNGTTKPDRKTTTITDSNNDDLNVLENNIVIVNGERGDTTVFNGGILKGTGKVGALTVQSGGSVAPGQSPGCLTAGNTTFNAGSSLDIELAGKTVCTEYDQLKITGTINLGNAALNVSRLNDFKPAVGDAFVIVANDGNDAITGTFNNLAEGATFTVDGYVFKVSYIGGDGNDAVITVQNVPTTPNTGMQLLTTNPLLTLTLTVVSAGALFAIAKRYSVISKK